MSWKVKISSRALEDLDHLRAYKQNIYRTAYNLTRAVEKDPFGGGGAPVAVPLIGDNVWCRRLSLEHRMVYEIFEDLVVVASYRTHFE